MCSIASSTRDRYRRLGRVAVAGIDLIEIDAWVVVASIHTYLNYAESLGLSPRVPTSASPREVLT